MHDEPRTELEQRALDALTAAEPPPGFADRVLAAQSRVDATRTSPPIGRLFAAAGVRVAALVLAAAAVAGAGFAALKWMSEGTGPEQHGASAIEPASAPQAPPSLDMPDVAPGVDLPADLADRVDRYLAGYGRNYGEAFKFHGIVVVLKDGAVAFSRAYGLADRAAATAIGPDTRFKIGSLTQTFTAAAVLQLRDRGLVDLDAPVRKYLPDYPGDAGARATVRQLLSHTSGIPSYTDAKIFTVGIKGPVAPPIVLSLFAELPLEFAPGTDFDLSNSGYYLLGLIIERVSGQPYSDYLRDHVLAPAGMTNSAIGADVDTVGYAFSETEVLIPAEQRHPSAYGAAGALVSTAADLAAWDRALRTPGLVLSQASLDDMTHEVRDDYGLGWFLRRERGQTLAFYPGGVEGYNATIARFLGDRVTVFALANTEAVDTRAVVYDVARLAYGEAVDPPAEHLEVAFSPAQTERFVGTYVLSEQTRAQLRPLVGDDQLDALAEVQIRDQRGILMMEVPDHGAKWMHSLGGDRFFFKDFAGTTAEFGPPGAPVAHLSLTQGELTFVLRRDSSGVRPPRVQVQGSLEGPNGPQGLQGAVEQRPTGRR